MLRHCCEGWKFLLGVTHILVVVLTDSGTLSLYCALIPNFSVSGLELLVVVDHERRAATVVPSAGGIARD